jgi:hypothetical protein
MATLRLGTAFYAKLKEAERKRVYASSVAALDHELTNLQLSIGRDPKLATVETATAAWQQGSQEIIERLGGTIGEQSVLDAFSAEAARLSEAKRVSVDHAAYRRQRDTGRASIMKAVQQYESSIPQAESDLERALLVKNLRTAVNLSDYFTEQEKVEILAGSRARMDAAEAAAEREQFAKLASDLEISVSRGVAGEQEVEQAYSEGVITSSKRTQLIKAIDAQKRLAVETEGRLRLVLAALDGSEILDPKNTGHKNAVDAYYARIEPEIAALDPTLQSEAKASFSAQVGVIPKAVRGEIRGALRAGTDEQAAHAADLYDRLREKNVAALEDFAQEDVDLAVTTQALVRAGIDPIQAVRDTREKMKRSPQEQEVRERLYRQGVRDKPTDEYLEGELSWWFRFDAEIPDAMVGELEFLARESYLRTGNLEAAREAALETLRRTWGVTTIGPKRWQKYAPEVIYRNGAGTDWIEEQFTEEMAARFPPDPAHPWESRIRFEGRLRLEPDLLTARERWPSYAVMLANDSGVPEPMLRSDGLPLRWRPEWETSPAKARIDVERAREREKELAKGEEELEKARAIRQRVAAMPDLKSGPELFRAIGGVQFGGSLENVEGPRRPL